MRVFIAIELPEEIKEYIYSKQKIIIDNSDRGNFSRKDNFHLTLRFIGEAKNDDIQRLKTAIDMTAAQYYPFRFTLGTLGYFPRKNKKIIWIGVEEGYNSLKELFHKLEDNLEKKEFYREERELNPHITVGREIVLNCEFETLQKNVKIKNLDIFSNKISLMESTRVDGMLTYRPIYCKHFDKASNLTRN